MKDNKKNIWRVHCEEDKYPGMWQRWFKNQCVAVGWPPAEGYHLSENKKGKKGWSTARNAIIKMKEGDFVVVAMTNKKIARIGEITGKAIEDDQWDPLVPKSETLPTGEKGRRIFVRWDLTTGPLNPDLVIKLPDVASWRGAISAYNQTIDELKKKLNDPSNWVGLLGNFKYEKALSDYIANYPHHLEDGLTPYPDSKIREKVFKDKSRADVLLIDSEDNPVVVECKQDSPSIDNVKQLENYMKNLSDETRKKSRGILVHGGSQKLRKEVSDYLKKGKNIEAFCYKLDLEFRKSN